MTIEELELKFPREPEESPEAYAARIQRESHLANQAAMLEMAGAAMSSSGEVGIVLPDLPTHTSSMRGRL